MEVSSNLSNADIRRCVKDNLALFVSDVDPATLSDLLIEKNVIAAELWQEIRHRNPTRRSQCRDLFNYLLTIQHPKAFLTVRKALIKENHYRHLLEKICKKEIYNGYREQNDSQEVASTLTDLDPSNGVSIEADISETEPLLEQLQETRGQLGNPEEEPVPESNRKIILKGVLMVALVGVGIAVLVSVIVVVSIYTPNGNNSCISDPIHLQTIRSKISNMSKPLCGLTILDNELFVVSEKSSEVEVYDSVNFSFSRFLNLKKLDLTDARGMVSCDKNKCLYIVDYKQVGERKEILRIDRNGTLIKNWFVGTDSVWSLSITDESNVILIFFDAVKLKEYSPNGEFIREIQLPPDQGFRHLWHAIKLTNGQFVVSHGFEPYGQHRVCIVDSVGNLMKSFGGKRGSGIGLMNEPVYFSVCGNGFILVVDLNNGRVLLLDSDLKFKREILSNQTYPSYSPYRIFLDQSNSRLYVGEYGTSRISIFNFK